MTTRVARWLALVCGVALVGTAGVVAAHGEKEKEKVKGRVVVFSGHARLGVKISDVTAEQAKQLQLPAEQGAVVEEVEADSPAAKAGLQANDVILSFGGETVRSVAQLRRLVGETPAGRPVSLQVSRAGQTRSVEVTLEERRAHFETPEIRIPPIRVPGVEIPEFDFRIFTRPGRLGISGDELTPQLAEYFGVKQGKGVLVREVLAGSAAAKAGLKAGDVIVRVDEDEIAEVGELRRALARKRESQRITLTIVRDRREQTLAVELEEPKESAPRRTAWSWVAGDPEGVEIEAEPGEPEMMWFQQGFPAGEEEIECWQQELKQRETDGQRRWLEAEKQI